MAGFLTRPAAVVVAGTMVMAVFLVLSNQLFSLTEHGGWALELNAFFFGAVAVAPLGPGKWSVPLAWGWWR